MSSLPSSAIAPRKMRGGESLLRATVSQWPTIGCWGQKSCTGLVYWKRVAMPSIYLLLCMASINRYLGALQEHTQLRCVGTASCDAGEYGNVTNFEIEHEDIHASPSIAEGPSTSLPQMHTGVWCFWLAAAQLLYWVRSSNDDILKRLDEGSD